MKKKATPAQLRALAKGRKKRAANLRRKRKRKRPKKMTKRRRINYGITGGSGDVNPQYYHGTLRLKATDTITEASYQLPVPRLPIGGRSTVLEILRIYWLCLPFKDCLAGNKRKFQHISFSTIPQGEVTLATFNEPNVFCQMRLYQEGAFTGGGSFAYSYDGLMSYDLTDGAGHGFLIGTDKIFVQCDSDDQTPEITTFNFKILYRFKSITLQEYIGIVQGQQ